MVMQRVQEEMVTQYNYDTDYKGNNDDRARPTLPCGFFKRRFLWAYWYKRQRLTLFRK
jgi:hypothetical protein